MRLASLMPAVCAAALLSSAALLPALAQDRMKPVGTVTFEPEPAQPETGVFNLKPEDRRMRSFRIAVDEGSAEVRSVTLIYASGERERVRVRQTLADGERSNVFRLEEPQPVRSVEVSYVPKGAVTLVLLADTGPPPPPPVKWVDLGCKSVGILGDRDKLPVTSQDRFRALRLRSTGYDIEMLEMLVIYGNGSRDNFVIRQIIPSGRVTNAIDLRGERRRIAQINFLYRATAIGTAKTKLCVEGLAEGEGRFNAEEDDN